jgi:cytochrome P450
MENNVSADAITDEWITQHFDHQSPAFARDFHPTLARARALTPVVRSDAYEDGFWLLTRYEDVLRTAQDWQTFSNALGITVPGPEQQMRILPVGIDPPEQREFKRLVNTEFTPAKTAPWEEPTRALVNELIDGFIERGECDFQGEFARPLPGLAFFQFALHAPTEDLIQVNKWATLASQGHFEGAQDALYKLAGWIAGIIQQRGTDGPRGDVIDTVMAAQIDGQPISFQDMIGTITLLILGGLETTSGVLGAAMVRFCEHPEILAQLRERPELIPEAVEELLRLDGSFVCIGRTARHDAELVGNPVKAGERVIMFWASANRDETEFPNPDAFDLDRERNRHVAFGAGPHRCVGSNLARMNLRVALSELVRRVHDVKLKPGADIEFHTSSNRAPESVPITFTPGPREA